MTKLRIESAKGEIAYESELVLGESDTLIARIPITTSAEFAQTIADSIATAIAEGHVIVIPDLVDLKVIRIK